MDTNKEIMPPDQGRLNLYLNRSGVLELRRLVDHHRDTLIDTMNCYKHHEKFLQFIKRHLSTVNLLAINRWQYELDEQVRQIQVGVKGRV